MFEEYIPFDEHHWVTTANGNWLPALGQGSLRVEACANGKKQIFPITNVCYVPEI